MVKLIIFDWDDVFTKGSTAGYFKSYHKALASVGVSLSLEEEKKRILAKWGAFVEEVIAELLKEHPQLVKKAVSNYEKILFDGTFVDCLSVVKETPALLERLSKHYILTVATGINPRLLKEKIMPKFKIPQVFTQVESVYDAPSPNKGKPHPYMVEQILSKQHILPQETVLVGDAKNDVLMARAAGVTPVVVLTGHLSKREAEDLKVKYIIDNVTLIEQTLSRIEK